MKTVTKVSQNTILQNGNLRSCRGNSPHIFLSLTACLFVVALFLISGGRAEAGSISKCDGYLQQCAQKAENAGFAIGDTLDACRNLRVCKQTCRKEKRECKSDARSDKKTCINACKKNYNGKKMRQCKRECRQEKRADKKECRQEKRSCKNDCRFKFKTQQCKDARRSISKSLTKKIGVCAKAAACISKQAKGAGLF